MKGGMGYRAALHAMVDYCGPESDGATATSSDGGVGTSAFLPQQATALAQDSVRIRNGKTGENR
jgi:hypothetical protein